VVGQNQGNSSSISYGVQGISNGTGSGGNVNIGVDAQASNGITNKGLNIALPAAGANNYAIYCVATAKNYFVGSIGLGSGQTTPTALLHFAAGTATASTAPLKFTSGTLLTTPEAGAVEFLTDKFYGTITTGAARKELALVDAALTSGKFPVATTNGRLVDSALAAANIPNIQATGRATAQTAANASVSTFTVGGSDGSFLVSANVLVTTSSAESFTATVSYTDEGNTARVVTFNFSNIGGTIGSSIAFANGAVPYEGIPLHIRAKAATAITVKTAAGGTYTGCTYNIEGVITQIA
jgi:hypothetical protein